MDYLSRTMETRILELTRYFPVVAILGARQVGKTTLVAHLSIEGLTTVTFDPVQDVGGARTDPDFFLQNRRPPLFLDEIQYAPELLASIKRQVDRERRPGQFILSGSQNLSVLKSISESLAGRVAVVELLPMSFAELHRDPARKGVLDAVVGGDEKAMDAVRHAGSANCPGLFDAVVRGGFPGVAALPPHLWDTYFASYRQTYIERDIRTVSGVSSLQTFGRFFGLLSALTAQEINRAQLGRELGVDNKTAAAWVDIALSTYQWHEIPAYSRNAIKRIAGKPKGYFVDTALACHLQRISGASHLEDHPLAGNLFETFVVSEIMKRIAVWPTPPGLYHYRTYAGAEVDLILERNGTLHPVEIKMTANPSRRDLWGIDSLKETFPRVRFGGGLLICAVPDVMPLREDVTAVPWWRL
mgnify:CR=1 FL=1